MSRISLTFSECSIHPFVLFYCFSVSFGASFGVCYGCYLKVFKIRLCFSVCTTNGGDLGFCFFKLNDYRLVVVRERVVSRLRQG